MLHLSAPRIKTLRHLFQDKIKTKGECLCKYLVISMCLKTQKGTQSCFMMNLKSIVQYFFLPNG